MADITLSNLRLPVPERTRIGSLFESGSGPSKHIETRIRSVSVPSGIPCISSGTFMTPFKSKLDPNSKPFSPRRSPDKGQCAETCSTPQRELESEWSFGSSKSNDSGCHLYEEKLGCDDLSVFQPLDGCDEKQFAKSSMDPKRVADFKMKNGSDKFKEDEKLRKIWSQNCGGSRSVLVNSLSSSSAVSSKSDSSTIPLESSKRKVVAASDNAEDCDHVFLPNAAFVASGCGQLGQRMVGSMCRSDDQIRGSNGTFLLPTPEDFPPFGPVVSKASGLAFNRPINSMMDRKTSEGDSSDDYGLRSLVKAINQTVALAESGRETSSVMSMDDLGFSQGFVQQYHQRSHQYVASPFDNRVVTPLADCNQVPQEYFHSNVTAKAGKLSDVDLRRASSDLLFFLFCTAVEDVWQLNAAYELFKRGWRYHKIMKIWLGFLPDNCAEERTRTYERGRYQFFNERTWSREVAEFTIYYEDVAGIGISQGIPYRPHNGRFNGSELKAMVDNNARQQREAALARAMAVGQFGAISQDYGLNMHGYEMPSGKY